MNENTYALLRKIIAIDIIAVSMLIAWNSYQLFWR